MDIQVSRDTKVTIVKYGVFRIFRDDKRGFITEGEFVNRFDEVWENGLRSSLEESIQEERIVEPHVVKNRIIKQYKRSEYVVKLVDNHKLLYEFTYKVLCVAQLEPNTSSGGFILDRLWSFTYSDSPPELLCFHFNSLEEKLRFQELAAKMGEEPRKLAKDIVLERMNNIEQQQELLDTHRKVLAQSLLQSTQFGLYTPPPIKLQIQECRESIARIKQILMRWNVIVEDLPDDNT